MTMRTAILKWTALAGLVFGLATAAADAQESGKLTVSVAGVRVAKGHLVVGLCNDPHGQFPGACPTGYQQKAVAVEGTTIVAFSGVKPGDYAVQVFHDENDNGVPDIPAEGFGYGNDQPYPPDFKSASVSVGADSKTSIDLTYLDESFRPIASKSTGAPSGPAMGSHGAPPPDGAHRIDVRENGLYAEFYAPDAAGRKPLIILMGGSEGGLDISSAMAKGFVKQGYAVLALAYFQEQGLPKYLEKIPLEYFDTAVAWAKARPEVDAAKIGAIGGSRGSEAVLLMASRNKDVRAVMAFAPSGIVWSGLGADYAHPASAWTAGGVELPDMIPNGAVYNPAKGLRPMFDGALAKGVDPSAEIPVEKINGPILLLSGEADLLWPSTPLAERIVQRLKDRKFKHPVEHLHYADVGHLVFMGDPEGRTGAPPKIGGMVVGGEPDASLAAWRDNWPKTLKFFDDALKVKR